MKRKILCFIYILISAVLTINFSCFTHLLLLITAPGFLFGAALTIPNIYPNFKKRKKAILIFLAYPVIWVLLTFFSTFLLILPATYADKTSYIIIGFLSGLAITITYEFQFGFKQLTIAFLTLISLGIFSILIGDYIFPHPYDKELNIGIQIAIWQILVGLGIIFNEKRPMTRVLSQAGCSCIERAEKKHLLAGPKLGIAMPGNDSSY